MVADTGVIIDDIVILGYLIDKVVHFKNFKASEVLVLDFERKFQKLH